jgi:signal recognition particle GTPase
VIRWFLVLAVALFFSSVIRAEGMAERAASEHQKGLELFEKYRTGADFKSALAAQKHFQRSWQLDPTLRDNYYYLGAIEHAVKFDAPKALEYFAKGCDLKESRSCDGARKAKNEIAANALEARRHTASNEDEAKLWEKIQQNYVKKGVPPATAKSTVEALKKGMAHQNPEGRLNSIRQLEAGSR